MTQPAAQSAKPKKKDKFHSYPFWSPRFWHGMRFGDLWQLFARNRFRMHLLRVPMFVLVMMFGAFNSVMHWIERWRFGKKIRETKIAKPPIFIIGHWRSGTTHLHELMVRDDRFAFPTTYECFAPSHFLVTEWFLPKLVWFLLPSKRPMDNMAAGFDHPQEDEFALVGLGSPSPYLRCAFPNDPPPYMEFLDMDGTQPADLQRFKSDMLEFVQRLELAKSGKQLILKSPPHTGRIEVLSQLFPGAIFIHIVRDPYSVFPSTRRLWRALDEVQGFQFPKYDDTVDYVFAAFERMYRGFNAQRDKLGTSKLYEVKYEDVVRDPVGELEKIYRELDLGSFDEMRPKLEAYVREQKDYRTNQHELEPELKAEIARRWSDYFERYGYQK